MVLKKKRKEKKRFLCFIDTKESGCYHIFGLLN